uniref:Uncharacterized protein n=1 Tax=uncultured marine virus TaxID=186617 RepID=A0A0F7LAV8_9VIRU|nr:hypothetical protein [uncultured marine virus]
MEALGCPNLASCRGQYLGLRTMRLPKCPTFVLRDMQRLQLLEQKYLIPVNHQQVSLVHQYLIYQL